jgi:hypothetical protein
MRVRAHAPLGEAVGLGERADANGIAAAAIAIWLIARAAEARPGGAIRARGRPDRIPDNG